MNPKQSKHIENHAQTHENKTEENQIQRKKILKVARENNTLHSGKRQK